MLVVQVIASLELSHQLYGEPSYHMNVRSASVQYMKQSRRIHRK